MLELYEGKLSRTVLRRGNGGNSVPLAGESPLAPKEHQVPYSLKKQGFL